MARLPSREQVFSALFALTSGVEWNIGDDDNPVIETFLERSRKIKLFSDAETQPWLGQAEHAESFLQQSNLPYVRTFQANWIVYHKSGAQPGDIPSIRNNLILDALQDALEPKPSDPGFLDERNTLSGLVYHCFIEGEIFKDPGDIDEQAMLVVPIRLLVP